MAKIAIEFKNIKKKFPNAEQYAVKEVSVSIEEGSFITILGTSGSGKTTLLKMVNRIYEATSGEILFFGESIGDLKVDELRRKIGYVIQQIGLFPHLTVAENIAIVPKILKWKKEDIEARIDYLLELVTLPSKEFRNRYPRQLSGGQQQRVGLARAMAADPAVMLMDEPFGAIDAITRQNLQDELIKIQRKLNKTILFVTHDINEAFKLGDKVIIMSRGEIQQFDTPYNILFNPANEFVSKLVSSEDILNKLKVIKIQDLMLPLDHRNEGKTITVSREKTAHEVLTIFLQEDIDYVIIENEKKEPIGKITLEQLKLKGGHKA